MNEDVRGILEGANFAHIATVRPDGSPHSVPVWIGMEDDRIVFFTQTGSRKARNLERDPRVALSVLDRRNPYRSAWVVGRVVERRDDERIWETIDRLSRAYIGEPFPVRPPTSVLYSVEIERSGSRELPLSPDGPQ